MRRPPPKREKGKGKGPRRLAGELMGVAEVAAFLGCEERMIRARAARHQLPYRKWGGRVIFLRSEIVKFIENLPGCPLRETRN